MNNNHHNTQNILPDIKDKKVAGKNTSGLKAYNIIYNIGHQKEFETKEYILLAISKLVKLYKFLK